MPESRLLPAFTQIAVRRVFSWLIIIGFLMLAFPTAGASDLDRRAASTVILTAQAEKNLRVKSVTAEPRKFESTAFAIGHLEEIPSRRAALSSRIAGRVVEVAAYPGDTVEKGAVLARIESRQPGNPPPVINLIAPAAGLVVESQLVPGAAVDPGTNLLKTADRSVLWAMIDLPQDLAAKLRPGESSARLSLPGLESPLTVTLERFAIEGRSVSNTIGGIFVVENVEGRFRPGMRIEASIVLATRAEVMAVPKAAIQGDAADPVVYVRDFEIPNAFVRAPVKLGEVSGEHVEIIGGLFPGDEVVVQGSYAIHHAGGGGGLSLKEALDAAHGHEHNEDGSEMTDEDKRLQADADVDNGGAFSQGISPLGIALIVYSVVTTLIVLLLAQTLMKQRGKKSQAVSN